MIIQSIWLNVLRLTAILSPNPLSFAEARLSRKPTVIAKQRQGVSFMENRWLARCPSSREQAEQAWRSWLKEVIEWKKMATRDAYGRPWLNWEPRTNGCSSGRGSPSQQPADFMKTIPAFLIWVLRSRTCSNSGRLGCSREKLPYPSTFFATGQAFEQIRNSIAYNKLNEDCSYPCRAYSREEGFPPINC